MKNISDTTSSARLFSLASKILFILVLWKHSGLRLWPHVYAGELYQPSRLVYYPEVLISVAAFSLCALNINSLKYSIKQQFLLYLFVLFAILIRFLPGSANLSPLQLTLGYWDSILSVALIIALCGSLETRSILCKFGVSFVLINLASLAMPSLSMMIGSFSGYARGLTAHRNDLAQIATISVFLILCAPTGLSKLIKWGSVLGGIMLVGLAGSVQGIMLLAVGLLVYSLASYSHLLKRPFSIFAILIILCIIVVLWKYISLDDLLLPFNRDSTFTGRDRIWALSIYLMGAMPWSGYGIGVIDSNFLSLALLESFRLGTNFGTSHNSYLESILAFGWIGGSLFLIIVFINSIRIFSAYLKRSSPADSLPAILMIMCVLGGLTSSEKMFWPGFGWLSFVLAISLSYDNSFITDKRTHNSNNHKTLDSRSLTKTSEFLTKI